MLSLSARYAAATADAQRERLLAAGEAMLATYTGTAFVVYYVLNGAALLLLAVVDAAQRRLRQGDRVRRTCSRAC